MSDQPTWDQRLALIIREMFSGFSPRPTARIEDWERRKAEAAAREENEARDVLRDRRARRGRGGPLEP